jgi:hypothetical protein
VEECKRLIRGQRRRGKNERSFYSYSGAISLLSGQHNGTDSMGFYKKTEHGDRVEVSAKDTALEEYGIYMEKRNRWN